MKSPSFKFYAQDFLTGCSYLTNEEIGLYIKLLCKQWTDEKIPKKRLGLFLGYEWESLSDELKQKFEDCGDYVLNKRLEIEREKQKEYKGKQTANGSKGGRPKGLPKNIVTLNNPNETQIEEKENPNNNPNETQKKPFLEYDNENEIENEIEKKRDEENFLKKWEQWIDYKKTQFKFVYATPIMEQMAINKLNKISNQNTNTAIEIIDNSMVNGWKGFFALTENTNNGKSKPTDKPAAGRQSAETIASNLQGWE